MLRVDSLHRRRQACDFYERRRASGEDLARLLAHHRPAVVDRIAAIIATAAMLANAYVDAYIDVKREQADEQRGGVRRASAQAST